MVGGGQAVTTLSSLFTTEFTNKWANIWWNRGGGGTYAPLTPLFHRPCYDVALSLNPNLAVEKISIHISYFFMTLIGERENTCYTCWKHKL